MSQQIIITLFGRKFDLTEFADSHPGGKAILEAHNGQDATEEFYEAGHMTKDGIMQQLAQFEVGKKKKPLEIQSNTQSKPLEKYIPNYLERIGILKQPKL